MRPGLVNNVRQRKLQVPPKVWEGRNKGFGRVIDKEGLVGYGVRNR